MQLKAADDKQPDIDALQALLERPDLDALTRRRIETELWAIRDGAKAERDAAYEIEYYLGENRHFVTIHDLRFGERILCMECQRRYPQGRVLGLIDMRLLLVLVMLPIGVLVACSMLPTEEVASVNRPLPDEAAAIQAARELTHLDQPVTVIEIEQGVAADLHEGPGGMFPSKEAAEAYWARLDRPAWRVVVTGTYSQGCGDDPACRLGVTQEALTIDRETGELLGIVIGDPNSGGPDIPCPPDMCSSGP